MSKLKKILKKTHRSSLRFIARQERRNARTIKQTDVNRRMRQINKEFKQAFKLLMKHPDTVTFFGSARFDAKNPYYQQARLLSRRIVEEVGSTIVTGGGGGIMEAANRGANDAHGGSIGMTIQLSHEQVTNQYVNYSVDFYYFFSRKVALSFTARAYVYFPGGFGTLDEFFEILTLKQTDRIDPIPIILIGVDYWRPLLYYVDNILKDNYRTVGLKDTKLYHLTDDIDEALRLIARPIKRQHQ